MMDPSNYKYIQSFNLWKHSWNEQDSILFIHICMYVKRRMVTVCNTTIQSMENTRANTWNSNDSWSSFICTCSKWPLEVSVRCESSCQCLILMFENTYQYKWIGSILTIFFDGWFLLKLTCAEGVAFPPGDHEVALASVNHIRFNEKLKMLKINQ